MALLKVILVAMLGLAMAFVPPGNWKTRFVGSYELNSEGYVALAMTWDENTAFAVDYFNYEVVILDTTDKHRPELLGIYDVDTEIWFEDVVLSADEMTIYLPTSNYNEGVHIVDVSDRMNPQLVGRIFDCEATLEYIVLSPDNMWAFVSDTENGEVDIFNITDKTNPQLYNYIGLCSPRGMDISSCGNTLYITDFDMGFYVYDVSNLDDPSIIGSKYNTGNPGFWTVTIAPSGDMAFVSSEDNGLYLIDVSNPSSALTLKAQWYSYWTGKVVLTPDSDIAFVVDYYNGEGLTILDVSDPCEIQSLGRYQPDNGNYAAVSLGYANWGRYVYIADGFTGNGLVVIGLAMPCDPTFQWDWTYPRHKEYQDDLWDGVNPLYVIMGLESPVNQP